MSATRADTMRRHGFSLLELIVVIGLIGIVTTWGYVILYRVDSAWNELRQRTELSAAADNIFETMKADFDAMVSPALAGVPIAGTEAMAETKHEGQRAVFNDSITLPVAGPEGQGLQRVRYYVDRSDGRDQLTRESVILAAGEMPLTQTPLNPGVNVAYLRCEFGAGADAGFEWLPRWDRPESPACVRVSMTLVNPDRPYIQVSRKAVFDVRMD